MREDALTLCAVGDVVFARDDPSAAFRHVAAELANADLRFCNLEVPLSDEGLPQHGKFETLHSAPAMIAGYVAGGFDVVSLANNHTMDYGPVALLDTIARLDDQAIAHCGAGPDRLAAWRPRTCTVGAATVGVTSFASEAFPGYGATETRPGIAMIRRDPLYGPHGVSPDDVVRMQRTVRAAGDGADWVLASFHWGLSQSRQTTVAQRRLGHAAIEAGADVVIGHHPHVLQGVEVYAGRPILYSLGNFVFDMRPHFFGTATYTTALARITLSASTRPEVELAPAHIGEDGCPYLLSADDERFSASVANIRDMSAQLGTHVALSADGARLRVAGDPPAPPTGEG